MFYYLSNVGCFQAKTFQEFFERCLLCVCARAHTYICICAQKDLRIQTKKNMFHKDLLPYPSQEQYVV